MTRRELLRRYPNASETFLEANASDPPGVPDPVAQPDSGRESARPDRGESPGPSRSRPRVKIYSFRRTLVDPDNLFVKPLVDAIRYEHLIEDDSLKHIVLEVSQRKVDKPEEEGTVVEIEYPE